MKGTVHVNDIHVLHRLLQSAMQSEPRSCIAWLNVISGSWSHFWTTVNSVIKGYHLLEYLLRHHKSMSLDKCSSHRSRSQVFRIHLRLTVSRGKRSAESEDTPILYICQEVVGLKEVLWIDSGLQVSKTFQISNRSFICCCIWKMEDEVRLWGLYKATLDANPPNPTLTCT
jgi:hypothetical protein